MKILSPINKLADFIFVLALISLFFVFVIYLPEEVLFQQESIAGTSHQSLSDIKKLTIKSYSLKPPVVKLLFLGDIMLDRGVEFQLENNGWDYPFEKIKEFLSQFDYVVANLEGAVITNPPNFGPNSMKFAFDPKVLPALFKANIKIVSLANNHSMDVGKIGYQKTQKHLTQHKIEFLGHPYSCEENYFLEKPNFTLLAFNQTFPSNCSEIKLQEIVRRVRKTNPHKFLIILLHWGEEYQPKSSLNQQQLAHILIDAGADLIIGTHPHVVQEIEEYKGKLIFYSLGNFVFDQYFSRETQESLGVGVEITPKNITFALIPFKSVLSQVFLMDNEEKDMFLEKLAQKSSLNLFTSIQNGKIILAR